MTTTLFPSPTHFRSVQRQAFAIVLEVIESAYMGAGKVADVDVIADAGAVRRIVVVAEDLHLVPLSGGRFASNFDQLRCLWRHLDRKSTRLNSSHYCASRMTSSA